MRVEPPTSKTWSRSLAEIGAQVLELGTGQRRLQMQRTFGGRGDKRQVDIRLFRAGKFFFCFFGFFPQALHRHAVIRQVNAVLGFALLGQPVHDALVKVVTAEEIVTAGGQHLHDAVAHADERHVKRAAAQVVDHDGLGAAIVQAVGQRGGRRLVDDAAHIQPRNAPGVLGGLALGIVKVGGHSDDRLGDALAQVGLGVGFQFLQDQRAQLLRRVALAIDGHAGLAAHQPLDAGHGAGGIGHSLPLGGLADQPLPRFGEGHDRGRCALALGIGDDDRFAAFDHRHTAVGGAQINSDHFCHGGVCPFKKDNFNSCFYCNVCRRKMCCDFVNITVIFIKVSYLQFSVDAFCLACYI